MAGILTIKNSINNLKDFFADILSGNTYYFWVGGTIPWTNETVPPASNTSYVQMEQSIYHDMVYGKQITNTNIAYLIPNIQWTSNTVYNSFDQGNGNYFLSNSYVVTSNYSIYKCIDNNNNTASTVMPTITPTIGTFQTSDGYTWKYMYSVPVGANTTFTTSKYVPVVSNTIVANNAIPGTIDVIRVLNGGSGYNTTNGQIVAVINPYNIIIAGNSSPNNNFYVNSSIYLNASLGASQIRQISSYDASTQSLGVATPFQTFVNLQLNNPDITGTFLVGQNVVQNITTMNYLYPVGFFNKNDIMQQSDTGTTGYVSHGNSSVIQFYNTTGFGFNTSLGNTYAIYNTMDSFFPLTGTVTTTAGSNTLTGVTANLLTLSVNTYIQVGANSQSNIRRITSITNNTMAQVDLAFANSFVANAFSQVNNAITPVNEIINRANGNITIVNLNSIKMDYSNLSSNALSFILGETVKEYTSLGLDLASNGIVSFVNNSTVILTSTSGSFSLGNFITGQSSTLKAQINNIVTYPNITLANVNGNFVIGFPVIANYANGIQAATSTLLSYTYTPSVGTQYIISPTVQITGDGSNAVAYSFVNTSVGSNNNIDYVQIINYGMNYTNATIGVYANSLYGNNAVLSPVISPVKGHGYDAVEELGCRTAGITVTFDTASNEAYYYPRSGSYRRIGIIKNPLFQNVTLNYSPLRANLGIHIITGAYTNNEIVFQPSTNSAALVKFANSTVLQIDQINGSFTTNATTNNVIIGLSSNAYANLNAYAVTNFNILANNQLVYQSNTQSYATLVETISNSYIQLANVTGKFIGNGTIYDPTNNTYANALTLYVANGVTSTNTFGLKFNQTSRVSLTANSNIPFVVGEYVNQAISNASALVLDISHDLDLSINTVVGSITSGTTLTDANTGANALILFANSSYLKLTGVSGNFNTGDKVTTLTGNAIIGQVVSVITFGDVSSVPFVYNYNLVGNTSGAIGYAGYANTITYPDLTRNTGDVIYLNNIKQFTLGLSTKETFLTTVQF